MKYKDYYEILGIERKAKEEDIKRAYRRLAKLYHPDSNPNDKEAEAKIRDINEAYGVLSNLDKRKKYDVMTADFKFWENIDLSKFAFKKKDKQAKATTSDENDNIYSEFFQTFFSNDPISLDDFFGTIRGKNRTKRRKFIEKQFKIDGVKGVNLETQITITLNEAYKGTTKKVLVKQLDETYEEYNVVVPAGIMSGEKIRLTGLGYKNKSGDAMGDLFVKVIVKEDSKFKLDGNDIYTKICLAPWEAVLGLQIKINTLDGDIDIRVPKNIQTGKIIKIAGKGFNRSNTRGDMYAELVIVIPSNPTSEETRLFECLQAVSKFNARDRKE